MLMLFFLFILGLFIEISIALTILGILFYLTHQAYNKVLWGTGKGKKAWLLFMLIVWATVFIFFLYMIIKLAFIVF